MSKSANKYKGYKIEVVGISRYIWRPDSTAPISEGYAQSMAGAKRWINADLSIGHAV